MPRRSSSGCLPKSAINLLAFLLLACICVTSVNRCSTPAPTTSAIAPAAAPRTLAPGSTPITLGRPPATASPLPRPSPTRPSAATSTPANPAWPSGAIEATLLSVTDGDTIRVSIDGRSEPVRLIGVDTPELLDPRKPVQCFAREASNHANELLTPGLSIGLEPDPTQDNRDKYDRLLRYVWLPDGRLFNLQTIAAGYAHEYTYDLPYKYQAQFKAAERQAREAEIGLWSPTTCAGDTEQPVAPVQPQVQQPAPPPSSQQPAPANPGAIAPPAAPPVAPVPGGRAAPQGTSCPPSHPIKGNRNSMIYHVPSSRSYAATKPEECFATEADAIAAGYRAPRN